MCFRPNSATASRRRSPLRRQAPTLPPLAMLDLGKLGERQAHDFLVRATRMRDGMWRLISLCRQGDVLLCVVRWVHSARLATPFSLAEVSLTEIAVCWRDHPSIEAARTEMNRHCAVPAMSKDAA